MSGEEDDPKDRSSAIAEESEEIEATSQSAEAVEEEAPASQSAMPSSGPSRLKGELQNGVVQPLLTG